MSGKTLIRNASILTFDREVGDLPSGDILIVDDRIAEVAASISADDAEIVDASGMIASPGFVDTHRHTWQTQLKGVAMAWSLFDYVCLMRSMYPVCYESNGVARKRNGTLARLDWPALRTRLLTSRDEIVRRFRTVRERVVRDAWASLWGVA